VSGGWKSGWGTWWCLAAARLLFAAAPGLHGALQVTAVALALHALPQQAGCVLVSGMSQWWQGSAACGAGQRCLWCSAALHEARHWSHAMHSTTPAYAGAPAPQLVQTSAQWKQQWQACVQSAVAGMCTINLTSLQRACADCSSVSVELR
jgi:hypothetical protein